MNPVALKKLHRVPASTLRYTSLQVLRGLAATMVVVFHLPTALGIPEVNIPILSSGVDIFFVISGFVMVVSTANAPLDLRAFTMQRFTRIVPLYWIMTFVMIAALWMFRDRTIPLDEIGKSLLFIPYLDTATGLVQPILGVGWTLNLEILFYLLFAVTLPLGAFRQIVVIGAVFTLAVAARVVFKPTDDTVLFFYTTPVLFEFFAGMVLGHLADRIRRLPVAFGVSASVFAIALIFVLRFNFVLPRTLDQGVPALIFVAGCINLENHFRSMAPRWSIRLGDASYSLYLTHLVVLLAAAPLVAAADISPWIAGALIVGASILVSLASYALMEKPLLTLFRTHRSGDKTVVKRAQEAR
ncbi:acyltransferase [Shinella zoogloeoides]|uniref:acyltransferase family protein n=1 Tax=Shinella zoogloeoides TaxID=352475 RepID=UPI0028A68215|nr:acyltransferase [Shinella zoogloeoides]